MGYQLMLSVGDTVDGRYKVIEKWHRWRTKSFPAGWRWRLLDLNTGKTRVVNRQGLREMFYTSRYEPRSMEVTQMASYYTETKSFKLSPEQTKKLAQLAKATQRSEANVIRLLLNRAELSGTSDIVLGGHGDIADVAVADNRR